jgi:hypothetical protein
LSGDKDGTRLQIAVAVAVSDPFQERESRANVALGGGGHSFLAAEVSTTVPSARLLGIEGDFDDQPASGRNAQKTSM